MSGSAQKGLSPGQVHQVGRVAFAPCRGRSPWLTFVLSRSQETGPVQASSGGQQVVVTGGTVVAGTAAHAVSPDSFAFRLSLCLGSLPPRAAWLASSRCACFNSRCIVSRPLCPAPLLALSVRRVARLGSRQVVCRRRGAAADCRAYSSFCDGIWVGRLACSHGASYCRLFGSAGSPRSPRFRRCARPPGDIVD